MATRELNARWISGIFLRDKEPNDMLDLIDPSGPAAEVEHMRQRDLASTGPSRAHDL